MDSFTVPRLAEPCNGSGPDMLPPLHPVALATLAHDVDKLLGLRDAKRRLDADERALTRRVLDGLTLHGLPALRAEHAVATVGTRTDLTVDPARFVETVGLATAAPALRVLVEQARRVTGSEMLSALGETTTTAVLRVEPIRNGSPA
jgi:hypothetical protein